MVTQSNIHFFTNWAKERLDEMDATVTSLEGKAAEVQADVRDKAQLSLGQVDAYRDAVEVMASSSRTPDAREGMAAFLAKRPPQWAPRPQGARVGSMPGQ